MHPPQFELKDKYVWWYKGLVLQPLFKNEWINAVHSKKQIALLLFHFVFCCFSFICGWSAYYILAVAYYTRHYQLLLIHRCKLSIAAQLSFQLHLLFSFHWSVCCAFISLLFPLSVTTLQCVLVQSNNATVMGWLRTRARSAVSSPWPASHSDLVVQCFYKAKLDKAQ